MSGHGKCPRILWLPALAIPLMFGEANGQVSGELDLDGVVGNGPDTIQVAVGEIISVDVWVLGPTPIISAGITLCNIDGALEFQGAASNLPATWTVSPMWVPGPCKSLSATDFSFSNPVSLPRLFHTFTYHAAVDQALASIRLDLNLSGWMNSSLESGLFSSSVDGSVQIGSTGISRIGWGKIKSLFR